MRSVANILQSDRLTSISQADTLGKSLEYFLYCKDEDLPALYCVYVKALTSSIKDEVESLIYTNYIEDTNTEHISYINHFLKDGIEYTTYPLQDSYTNQVTWLYKNCKKTKDI